MSFTPGQAIVRRYVRGDRYTWAQPMRVVADDDAGLLLWYPIGSDFARLIDAYGNTQHEVPLDQMTNPVLTATTWQHFDILVLMPPGVAYSVWWFFNGDGFAGWYVNLESPYVRHPDAVETVDHLLDIWVEPDRTWRWKDEDEFSAMTDHPLYFDTTTAAAIRAQGEQALALVEAGVYPFDGTHTDFRPDPMWTPHRLPDNWQDTHRSLRTQ